MSMGWDEIEREQGFAGLKAHAEANVLPILSEATLKPVKLGEAGRRISGAMTASFVLFVVTFMIVQAILSGTWWGEVLIFLLFPVLFFGFVLGGLYAFRGTLVDMLLEAKQNFIVRGRALSVLCEPLGLTYVPAPGGLPGTVKWLLDQSWAPRRLRELASVFDEHGGMETAVGAARDAGLMIEGNVYVIGTAEQKAKYQEMAASGALVEDGFHGARGDLAFDMFEWVERVEDKPDIHHLMIVLEAPVLLHGVTQLRARGTGWPQDATGARLTDVDLGPRAFDALYRLRSSDQVEARNIFNPAVIERVIALAEGGKFRAVGRGRRLVFDFPGTNRFNLIDLTTGQWSEETLRQTASDLVEALTLIDTLRHAFMLVGKSDTGGA